ncbi:hypothetical protein [Mesorhizobium sp. CA5]|uniref:hypothetical protein n=1 Tax=Mesorhizobium sp. CA5 TaxID=2876638 RepID=UPI001CD16365|nr:hypothetical protein [Mesorhizobium sp. CA5]MBZ9843358.1 hypothetical protein [Mesorhizobium sp. CA5]
MQYRGLGSILFGLSLAGCGTTVPSIQDYPAKRTDLPLFIQTISESVRCQIQQAVAGIVNDDKENAAQNGGRAIPWFDNWGVKYSLRFQVVETGTINPSLIYKPAAFGNTLFTLGAGGSVASTATREVKENFYFSVKDLVAHRACQPVRKPEDRLKSGLISDDLGLRAWLASYILATASGAGRAPADKNTPIEKEALTDRVNFKVVASGNLNPGWTLKVLNIDSKGDLLSASRDRSHELLITYGPIDPGTGKLSQTAGEEFFASTIKNELQNP